MSSSSTSLFCNILAIVVFGLVAPAIAEDVDSGGTCTSAAEYCWNCPSSNTSANATAAYIKNLDTLFASLSSINQTNYGFYNSSLGTGADKVNFVALCRGDLALNDCRACYKEVSFILSQNCSSKHQAIIWAQSCNVRYSNVSIGIKDNEPAKFLPSPNYALNPEAFKQVLYPLMEFLSQKAAAGNTTMKFAAGHAVVPFGSATNPIIYAATQCRPDLDQKGCSDCLAEAVSDIYNCCERKDGARVLKPSCNLRFERGIFYDAAADILVNNTMAPPPSSLATAPPTQSGPKGNRKVIIIVVSVGASLVTLVLFICICLRFRKSKKKIQRKLMLLPGEDVDEISNEGCVQYDFDTIRNATDNFSEANKLGEGGFGSVYKGQLSNGELVAVKRLSLNSRQGDIEFKNEVLLMAKLQHRNLVRLLGFCLEGNERVLAYEYVPNTSLDHIIFDPIKRGELDWDGRYKIIVGIVRGLMYLHEDSRLRIIHRDLKVSNILLDDELNPKIADFGMARLFVHDQTQGSTSRIVGTYGYMAPEYAMHGKFSVKSDVYSFGVLVLEIVSGQKNSSFRHGENTEDLLTYAWTCWIGGTTPNLIDPTLRNGYRSEIMRCIQIGLLCVQENVVDRPTMASISVMLNSYSLALPVPSPPSAFMTSTTDPLAMEYTSTVVESSQSNSISNLIDGTVANEDWTELYPR